MTIRVLVADDQPLMRTAYDMTVRTEDDIEIVGEAADGQQAIDQARRLHPDVVLMDIRMPVLDGVEATRILGAEEPTVKVLILTTFDYDEYVVEALRAGASGFLLKDVRPEELIEAIRIVARGDALLAPSVTRRLLEALGPSLEPFRPKPVSALSKLTESERRVLALVGKGMSNEEIGRELFVAETTVRTHLRHILDKLGLRNRVQAVVFAYDTGLVQPNPQS
ncbi:MAG TPA: response regulator transcription factor [Actinomycetota bacterium]|nr:response regulator transcription factor [Actinomycetota bacterium]